jgi:hypothetical protein
MNTDKNDLGWARADLAHASKLYGQVMLSQQPVDETWSSNARTWHFRASKRMAFTESLPGGGWDATVTAEGDAGDWMFAWSGDGWFASRPSGLAPSARKFRCYLGLHRWQRLRAAGGRRPAATGGFYEQCRDCGKFREIPPQPPPAVPIG